MNPISTYAIPDLPPAVNFETIEIYKHLVAAKSSLAELKGLATTIPNKSILIDTLALQEARASSEIENIVTTQDALFRGDINLPGALTGPVKEVERYRDALKLGWDQLQSSQNLITNRMLVSQYQLLKQRDDGLRDCSGTVLKNNAGEIVYVPPQMPDNIIKYMTALERYINEDDDCSLDPLIKMAIIHHQFESIHPFSDGNGRVGRMLNVLFLCKVGLLDSPILYLSRAINARKNSYYRLLQAPRDVVDNSDAWQNWVIFMLTSVAETAESTIVLVRSIRDLMSATKLAIRDGNLSKIYSQDLLNNLFRQSVQIFRSKIGRAHV